MPNTELVEAQPLFGRERELSLVEELLRSPAPRPALVCGPAGIGKSRLIQEVAGAARSRVRVLVAHCYESDEPAALLPVYQLLSQEVRLRGDDQVLGVSTESLRAGDADLRARLFTTIVERLLSWRPVPILVFEDIQWCDRDSLLFLNHLIDMSEGRLPILASLRTPAPGRLAAVEARFVRVELARLPPDATRALANWVCPGMSATELGFLEDLSQGNPLFVAELARHLRTSGLLIRQAAMDILRRGGLPTSLAGLIDARCEQLSPTALRLAQTASCVGRSFSSELLRSVVESPGADFLDSLAELRAAAVIKPPAGRASDEGWFEFAHPLIRERLYERMDARSRREAHRRLGATPVALPWSLGLGELAVHQAEGADEEGRLTAFQTCGAAAAEAESILAFESAVHFWRLALRCSSPDAPRDRAEVLRRLGLAYRAAGQWEQAIPTLERAAELLVALDDRESAARVAAHLGEMCRFRFELPEALRWCSQALVYYAAPSRERMWLEAMVASVHAAQDDQEQAEVHLDRVSVLGEELGGFPPEAAHLASFTFTTLGRHEEARTAAEEGLREAIGSRPGAAVKTRRCSLRSEVQSPKEDPHRAPQTTSLSPA